VRKLVTIKFGSHLYGTSTPASDIDFKSVHVPAARDLLLQRAKGSINTARVKKEKNLPGEVEEESYSLQRYLQLAAEGQTVALDMLFAPEWSMTEPPSAEWREIAANRDKLATKKSAAFLGYCRQQANKYGIKGSRVAAARAALARLDHLIEASGRPTRLGAFAAEIAEVIGEYSSIVDIQVGDTDQIVRHWDVCGRKLPFTSSVGNAHDVVQKLVDEYGQRALQAESQQGVDWKALSHAVRVGHQAIELLSTGRVTFPLPNAEHVLAIKTGKYPYQEVAAEIEYLLEAVENAAAQSSLPQEPDRAWIEAFVLDVYGREVAPIGLVERARTFAVASHAAVKQLRKYTNEAYSVHPAAVAKIVESVPHTTKMVAAAFLHDVVEDTGITIELIRAEFGDEVAELVGWLTDISRPTDGNRAVRRAIDRAHSAKAPKAAQTIKLADIIDNNSTIEQHDPNFAVVWREEKRLLLAVMTDGDPTLMKRALEGL